MQHIGMTETSLTEVSTHDCEIHIYVLTYIRAPYHKQLGAEVTRACSANNVMCFAKKVV